MIWLDRPCWQPGAGGWGSTGKRGHLQGLSLPRDPPRAGDSLNQPEQINPPSPSPNPWTPWLAGQLTEVLESLPACFVFLKSSWLWQLVGIYHRAPNQSNSPAAPSLSRCCDVPSAVSAVWKLLALPICPQGRGLEPGARKEPQPSPGNSWKWGQPPVLTPPPPWTPPQALSSEPNPTWELPEPPPGPSLGRYRCWPWCLGFPSRYPGQDPASAS